jgi:TrmH family RNA methyltransferase
MVQPPKIASTSNPLARRFREVARGHGRAHGLFLLEGRHLLDEALKVGWPLEAVLVEESRWYDWRVRLQAAGAEVTLATRDLLEKVGTAPSPEGVLALGRRPESGLPDPAPQQRFLYLDGVQDPVNVGILVRSAVAFGCAGLFTGPGTADPFGPTALSRSAGAALHRPPVAVKPEALVRWCERGGVALLAAQEGGRGLPSGLHERPLCLAHGNEGHGLSGAVLAAAEAAVGVPMVEGWDSLNVAAAGSVLLAALSGMDFSAPGA